jgi:hypothetical protein
VVYKPYYAIHMIILYFVIFIWLYWVSRKYKIADIFLQITKYVTIYYSSYFRFACLQKKVALMKRVICNSGKSTYKYIHSTHVLSPKEQQRHLRYSSKTPTFYQNHLAMRQRWQAVSPSLSDCSMFHVYVLLIL